MLPYNNGPNPNGRASRFAPILLAAEDALKKIVSLCGSDELGDVLNIVICSDFKPFVDFMDRWKWEYLERWRWRLQLRNDRWAILYNNCTVRRLLFLLIGIRENMGCVQFWHVPARIDNNHPATRTKHCERGCMIHG